MTTATSKTRSGAWSGYLFVLPYLLLFTVFLLAPLAYGFSLSFYRRELLSVVPPKLIGLANYSEALHDPYFWKALWATLRFVALCVPFTMLTALSLALGLNGLKGRLQTVLRAAVFVPTVLTISVAGILWRWFYNGEFGLFNAYLHYINIKPPWLTSTGMAMVSIALMTLWWTVGGPTVVLLAGLHNIPPQYMEAAEMDGAVGYRRFRYITLPLLKPVLLFVMVLNIIGSFQVFGQTFMITRGGPEMSTRSLVQYIYETAFNNYRMGYASALSWLLFLVIATFSAAQFRLMRER